MQVRLKALSATGVGLAHTARLDCGGQFIVQLPQPNGQTKNLLYTVVRCDTEAGGFNVGAELACVLPADGNVPAGQNSKPAARDGATDATAAKAVA